MKELCRLFGSKVPGANNVESLPPPEFENIRPGDSDTRNFDFN